MYFYNLWMPSHWQGLCSPTDQCAGLVGLLQCAQRMMLR